MNRRKICVVTGSRAEYDLLYWVLKGIQSSSHLELSLVVCGMHLSTEFGLTYKRIEEDGFNISKKVEMLLSADSASATVKSTALGMIGFAEVFEQLKPDLIVLLGDRFELLAAASSALMLVIPIAHLHGGEVTEGAYDESIRHSITKMSHLHFVATDEYRNRVIQMGENPSLVFNFGATGVENLRREELIDTSTLRKQLALPDRKKNLLITWHPTTLMPESTLADLAILLEILGERSDLGLIFTKANADSQGRAVNQVIEEFVANNQSNSVLYTSLGRKTYLSALMYVDAVVGNSSSGIIEAPSAMTATLNIGDRQKGRVRAPSVVDCIATKEAIKNGLQLVFEPSFQESLQHVSSPYGDGHTSEKIVRELERVALAGITRKTFHDQKGLPE